METSSEFLFSNPPICTVHLDEILPDDRDDFVTVKIETLDRENSPCFCFQQDLKILPCSEEDVEKTTYILVHI